MMVERTKEQDRRFALDMFVCSYGVPSAIEMMRQAGMNETRIACVVTSIRAAAINAEFSRIQELMRLNPPTHIPHGEMQDAIERYSPAKAESQS